MSCQICGRGSAPGAKLCADCYAARKRAYDATITQPLVMAGAGGAPRTLSRLRRSASSPEAKARRAVKKAGTAAAATAPLAGAVAEPPAAAPTPARSRLALWLLLAIGVVLAAVAGWYLPHRGHEADPETMSPPAASPSLSAAIPLPAPMARLPAIVERDWTRALPPIAKLAPRRTVAAPRPAMPETEAAPAVEIVRMPPRQAPAPPPQPASRKDVWQEMKDAIARCPADEFLARVVCEQRVRLQYCDGHWGQVPQCPGGPGVDHS